MHPSHSILTSLPTWIMLVPFDTVHSKYQSKQRFTTFCCIFLPCTGFSTRGVYNFSCSASLPLNPPNTKRPSSQSEGSLQERELKEGLFFNYGLKAIHIPCPTLCLTPCHEKKNAASVLKKSKLTSSIPDDKIVGRYCVHVNSPWQRKFRESETCLRTELDEFQAVDRKYHLTQTAQRLEEKRHSAWPICHGLWFLPFIRKEYEVRRTELTRHNGYCLQPPSLPHTHERNSGTLEEKAPSTGGTLKSTSPMLSPNKAQA